MYNTTTQTWDDVYVKIDETTGKLSGIYNLNTQNIGSMTKNDASALQDEIAEWQQTAQGILTNCLIIGDAYLDTSGNITNASNEIIGKLVEVQDENGNVVSSIQDVNGNPIKIGENTADVINKLKETRNQVDATNGKKANIDVTDNGTASKVQRNIDNISSYKQVIVGVQYTSSGKPYYNGSTMYATGTENAMPGIASVAEYGPELIQSRSGELTFATTRQLVNMDGGETVYNARQTKEILNSMNKPKISNQESTLLKEISIKLDYLKEIASKEFNKITENIIQQVDVNGVTDLRELIEELTEYTELREL